jgi:hypothetical protein
MWIPASQRNLPLASSLTNEDDGKFLWNSGIRTEYYTVLQLRRPLSLNKWFNLNLIHMLRHIERIPERSHESFLATLNFSDSPLTVHVDLSMKSVIWAQMCGFWSVCVTLIQECIIFSHACGRTSLVSYSIFTDVCFSHKEYLTGSTENLKKSNLCDDMNHITFCFPLNWKTVENSTFNDYGRLP